jgi:hypothetical protein
MLTFNTLLSLAYGPPALLGLVVRRTPPWSGLITFTLGMVLGAAGAFIYQWGLMEQVAIIIPSSFGVFFVSMLFDKGDSPERARLFADLNTPINVKEELKDSPDLTPQVFRFLSRTIACIGGLSLLLLFATAGRDRITVLWFAGITLAVSLTLSSIPGRAQRGAKRLAMEVPSTQ